MAEATGEPKGFVAAATAGMNCNMRISCPSSPVPSTPAASTLVLHSSRTCRGLLDIFEARWREELMAASTMSAGLASPPRRPLAPLAADRYELGPRELGASSPSPEPYTAEQ